MRRRDFLTLLGGVAVAWPHAARAQQPGKTPTIGFLGPNTRSAASEWVAPLVQRLRELGWIDARNIAIEYRWAEGRAERFAEIAAEFVRLKVDVIVTSGTPAVLASMQATSVIPIVFATAGDPVGSGLVASGGARSRVACYGLSGCWPPCTDLTNLPGQRGLLLPGFRRIGHPSRRWI
jgi:putative ABC transport system substrate-binding protein